MSDPSTIAVAFVRALRRDGLPVPTSCSIGFAEALTAVGLSDRSGVYWAGRATLVRRREDIAPYDRVFGRFWDSVATPDATAGAGLEESVTLAVDVGDDDPADDDGDDRDGADDPGEVLELRFSATEVLRHKDFSQWTPDELAEGRRLMAGLRLSGESRRSLRTVPVRRSGDAPDLRRTVRAAIASDGVPLRRHWRSRSRRPRRLVLLLDVSGSMEPYARALVRFAHAAVVGRQKVEVFALGTRLTRITRELAERNPDRALERAGRRVSDWSGGTRLGEGLTAFNRDWGQRGMARGAIVVILSDGWDRGDPDALAEQMRRLHRMTHRLVWVNPLKVTPGYAPLARGMAAALPHVDEFVEGHSLDALEHLADVIAGRGAGGARPGQTSGVGRAGGAA
ncbi:MAG: hypothetical protein RIR49_1137 [Actinomycetota bacterium]